MKIKNIASVGQSVLLKLTTPDKIRGLHLPAKYSGQAGKAEVIATGPDVTRCKVGDFVVLGPRGRIQDADFNDSSLQLLDSDEAVIAVVEYEDSALIVPVGVVAQA